MPESYLETAFQTWLDQYSDLIPTAEREYRFHPTRRWRFDFAWPMQRVAVEIAGITPDGGRHQKRQGFLADAEKYEAALQHGWTVYRVPGPWVAEPDRRNGARYIWRHKVMETLALLLKLPTIPQPL